MPKGKANKKSTPELRKAIIETAGEEKLNYRETARRFYINAHKQIVTWKRLAA